MSPMAKLTHQKVIHHRGGMRPGTPDPAVIRPGPAPADKGGEWQSRSSNTGRVVRNSNTNGSKPKK